MKIKTLLLGFLLCAFSLEARITSVDPAREHFNPYKYAGNNPIVTVDPDGNADVIVNDPNQKGILEAAIDKLPGPLANELRNHDFAVDVLPDPYYEAVLGETTFDKSELAEFKSLTKKQQGDLYQSLQRKGMGRYVLIRIKPELLLMENYTKLQTTLYHETSHALDYLSAIMSHVGQGGPLVELTRLKSEINAYKEGNNFIFSYLKLSLNSPAGIAAGAVLNPDKHLTLPGVIDFPEVLIKDTLGPPPK